MQKKPYWIVAWLVLLFVILFVAANNPYWVETLYSMQSYRFISIMQRLLTTWLPFSVGDILYTAWSILIIRWLYLNFSKIWKQPRQFFKQLLLGVLSFYTLFLCLWGLNYYRTPLHEKLELDAQYTTQELIHITQALANKANTLQLKLVEHDTLEVLSPYNNQEIFALTANRFPENNFKIHNLNTPSLKPSMWNIALSYMGYGGYYNPFTGEAQVNNLITTYNFPVIALHEQAHQLGYAAENEANFLATWAALAHPNTYIQYSGALFALRYCLYELSIRDTQEAQCIKDSINTGILKNYASSSAFWMQFETPLEDLTHGFWNLFLKANNQPQGISSYNYMVGLVVSYYKKHPL